MFCQVVFRASPGSRLQPERPENANKCGGGGSALIEDLSLSLFGKVGGGGGWVVFRYVHGKMDLRYLAFLGFIQRWVSPKNRKTAV